MIDTPRDFIAHLVGAQTDNSSDPLDLLEDVGTGHSSPSVLNGRHEIGEKTIYRALEFLVEARLVLHPNGSYDRTGLGVVVQRIFDTALSTPGLTRDSLGYLTASHYRVPLLRTISSNPAEKVSLSLGEETPSRSTVHRSLARFEEEGWIVKEHGEGYRLTRTGEQVLEAYETLTEAIQFAETRAEFLYCCGDEIGEIPLDGLADADLYTHTPVAPDRSRGRCESIMESDLTTFRALLSRVSFSNADLGTRVIASDVETEVIVTEQAFYNLPTRGEYRDYVKQGLEAKNFNLLIAPDIDVFPTELALCDETVMLGPATDSSIPQDAPAGTVVGSDDALVSWADDLYTQYRSVAQSPPEHVLDKVIEAVSKRIPLGDYLPASPFGVRSSQPSTD